MHWNPQSCTRARYAKEERISFACVLRFKATRKQNNLLAAFVSKSRTCTHTSRLLRKYALDQLRSRLRVFEIWQVRTIYVLGPFSRMSSASTITVILFLLSLLLLLTAYHVHCEAEHQKKALVFGGNGFIGSEIVLRLLDEGYHVTTTNRGNWYWDSPVRVKTRVHAQFPCDRDDGVLNCWDLRNYISKTDFFDIIVDLTAYKYKVVEDLSKALAGKAGLYLLISSDSVYQVTRRDEHRFDDPDGPQKPMDEDRPWREEDAVRPYSATLRERLQENDPYGHDKLSSEEALIHQRKDGSGIPFVIFRLPDVLGGRDTTNRWFPYQMWIQFAKVLQIPLRISARLADVRTSYVFVHDVADAVVEVLRRNGTAIWDKAYNLAFDEGGFTLEEVLRAAQKAIGNEDMTYERLDSSVDVEASEVPVFPGAVYMFPSVQFGWVDVNRAKELLGWKPTPFEDAIRNVTTFYREAFTQFPLQRNKALGALLHTLVPEERKAEITAVFDAAVQKADEEMARLEGKEKKQEL